MRVLSEYLGIDPTAGQLTAVSCCQLRLPRQETGAGVSGSPHIFPRPRPQTTRISDSVLARRGRRLRRSWRRPAPALRCPGGAEQMRTAMQIRPDRDDRQR
jgi:hypothetical protein